MSALASLPTASVHWFLLLALNHMRGMGASDEDLLLRGLCAVYPHATRHDVRPALEYLEALGLVDLVRVEHPWRTILTNRGHGVCIDAINGEQGIAWLVEMFETGAPRPDPPCHAVHTTSGAIRGNAEYPRRGSGLLGLSEPLARAGDGDSPAPAGADHAFDASKRPLVPFTEGGEYLRRGSAPAALSVALRRSDDARA